MLGTVDNKEEKSSLEVTNSDCLCATKCFETKTKISTAASLAGTTHVILNTPRCGRLAKGSYLN